EDLGAEPARATRTPSGEVEGRAVVTRTLIVEPDPRGHRFEAVGHVARVAGRASELLLITSRDAMATEAYLEQLGDGSVPTEEHFSEIEPSTKALVTVISEVVRRTPVDTIVVMEDDRALKQWCLLAPKAFRGIKPRPRIVF